MRIWLFDTSFLVPNRFITYCECILNEVDWMCTSSLNFCYLLFDIHFEYYWKKSVTKISISYIALLTINLFLTDRIVWFIYYRIVPQSKVTVLYGKLAKNPKYFIFKYTVFLMHAGQTSVFLNETVMYYLKFEFSFH